MSALPLVIPHRRKPKVHESDVGPMPTETLDGLMSVRGLRHNLHVRLAVDNRDNPLADERVIVDTQNADRTFHSYLEALKVLLWQLSLGSMDYGYL